MLLLPAFVTLGVGHGPDALHRISTTAPLRVRLCASGPLSVPPVRPLVRGIERGVILATEQWKRRFHAEHLNLLPPLMLDDGGTGGTFDPNREKRNALTCVGRSDAFGYIGPLNSGAALISQPILNRAAMVQISPSNTAVVLTSRLARARQQPATSHHRLAYLTYYRMLTTDALMGPSDAALLRIHFHARSYVLIDDSSSYGSPVTRSMASYARAIGLRLLGSIHVDTSAPSRVRSGFEAASDATLAKHPDGVMYAGDPYGGILSRLLRKKGYSGPIVGDDHLLNPEYAKGAGSGAVKTFAVNPGPDPAAAAPSFRRVYARRFHTSLQGYDAPAFDAANIVLNAIYQAATEGRLHGTLRTMRAAILPHVARMRWHGAIGATSFDPNGDTRNRIISVYMIHRSKQTGADPGWVYVGKAPEVRGVIPAD